MAKKLILIVEDDPLVSDVVEDHLTEAGLSVLVVPTADEGMDLLRTRMDICLVISDINLPGAHDGVELADWMRRNRSDVTVVLMSGRVDLSRSMLPPNASFFRKPLDFARLVALAEAHCGFHRAS